MLMSTVLSANVLHRDVHGVEARIAIYDDHRSVNAAA
jgi:hypothetical protein